MSGGSHNYLYSRATDEIGSLVSAVEGMADAIRASGFPFCADETMAVVLNLRAAQALAERFADLWHAQEWHDSGDTGVSAVRKEAIKLGEPLPPCQHLERGARYGYRDDWKEPPHRFLECEACGEQFDAAPSTGEPA